MGRPKKVRQSAEEINISLYGSEPKILGQELSKMQVIQSLNWYQSNRERKHALEYFKAYVKKSKLPEKSKEALETVPDSAGFTTTVGYVSRMLTNGVILPKANKEWFEDRLKELLAEGKENKKNEVVAPAGPTIQERIAETTASCIGELEGLIDDSWQKKFKEMGSAVLIMQDHNIKAVHARKIIEHFKKMRDEIMSAIVSKDEQDKEAYSNFGKVELKRFAEQLQSIVDKASDFVRVGNATRKPRKRRVKTPEQLVNKMILCVGDDALKVKSLEPALIIGAAQVWVYNRKYRKLGVYNADDASGLTVKGSTIKNFTESTSVAKKLRKPEQVVPEVVTGGKVFLRNVLENIRAKESSLTGRINSDTILLRALK